MRRVHLAGDRSESIRCSSLCRVSGGALGPASIKAVVGLFFLQGTPLRKASLFSGMPVSTVILLGRGMSQVKTETLIHASAGKIAQQKRRLRPANGNSVTETLLACPPTRLGEALLRRLEIIRDRMARS